MKNLSLLSLTIIGSFMRSPFLQTPISSISEINNFQNINCKYFFNSFLKTRASCSSIKDSTFDHFITFHPVLSFDTTKENKIYYNNIIPSEDKNPFYNKKITTIKECQFMSIIDNTQEQLLPDVGLCVYTTLNTTITGCLFYAITSYRSGSAIFFDHVDSEIVYSKVENSLFKSITQKLMDFGNNFLTGGAISHGKGIVNGTTMSNHYIDTSTTSNCAFRRIRLIGDYFNGRQLGIVTYISRKIDANGLNFTENELGGESRRYGALCTFFSQRESENSFRFINIFDSDFIQYGVFSATVNSIVTQVINLSNANFVNNTNIEDQDIPLFGIELQASTDTKINAESILCISEFSFFGISQLIGESVIANPIIISIDNCVFTSQYYSSNSWNDKIKFELGQGNSFNASSYENPDLILLTLNYAIETSHFSPSESFSNKFVQDSATFFDLDQASPWTAGALAAIFGIISFIVFIFLICVRRTDKKNYHMVGEFQKRDQFDQIYRSDDSNNPADEAMELKDINNDDDRDSDELNQKPKRKKSINETTNLSQEETDNNLPKELDENNQKLDSQLVDLLD